MLFRDSFFDFSQLKVRVEKVSFTMISKFEAHFVDGFDSTLIELDEKTDFIRGVGVMLRFRFLLSQSLGDG